MANETTDAEWMWRALTLARQGEAGDGTNPIGCVIVRNGELIAEGCNEVDLHCDPTAHAEIVAIRRAGISLGTPDLRGVTLYTTLQPCGMCTMASIWAKVSRIVFGAGRGDVHAMYFEDRNLDTIDFIRDAFRDDLSLTGGVLVEACSELYPPPDADIPKEEQFNR